MTSKTASHRKAALNWWLKNNTRQPAGFYRRSAPVVAKDLLGCCLIHRTRRGVIIGWIVETEAYGGRDDPASHAYRGPTPRNAAMFGPAGRAYIYFTYGMHYCLNIVTGRNSQGQAVLIRALEPVDGLEQMRRRRPGRDLYQLTNGPAKLVTAMGITIRQNGQSVRRGPLVITRAGRAARYIRPQIISTTRIGITHGRRKKWRFYLAGNPFVSRQ